MTIEAAELEELKAIYLKHYGITLSDFEAMALGTRLVNLFKILINPIISVDRVLTEGHNGDDHGK